MCSEFVNRYDAAGNLVDGFDYQVQVWVIAGICSYIGAGGFFVGEPITQVRKKLGLPPIPFKWPNMKPRLAAYRPYR
jgi:hypothetical protein